jgi:selenocysteine lyase/cysteine desulfurase
VTAYLNYAGGGRLRPRAREAMHAALDDVLPFGTARGRELTPMIGRARQAAATLLDCAADEIALVPNTSTAVHLVADGLDWRAGDEIVLFDTDFPTNVRPWTRLADRGVTSRWVPMRDGGYDMSDLAALLSPATRLVAVSHVHFITGYRIDLDAVCALAREVGALVCVDAVQGLGVVPLSVRRTPVDFLAAGGHKWLCGPAGTGLFYCRADRLDLLRGGPTGWLGYEGAAYLHQGQGGLRYDLPLHRGARRFEGGIRNILGLVGFAHALEELCEVGVEATYQRVLTLTDELRTAVRGHGYDVLGRDDRAVRSGIVGFSHPARPNAEVHAELTGRGCHLSFPDGRLRASPHYWTTDDELAAFVSALAQT